MALIHIQQWPHPVESGRMHILDAALAAGVPYPHSCSSGECGSCKSRLTSGQVTMELCSPDALTQAERDSGLVLACRSKPVGDVSLCWLSASAPMPVLKIDTTVSYIAQATHDVVILKLALPAGKSFDFRPGQYAKLRIGSLPQRSYSMANQPGQELLEFHIRVLPDGQVSGVVAGHLKVGDCVQVQGPFGDAHWDNSWHTTSTLADTATAQSTLLLLAGGTGLAPMASVLDAALQTGVQPQRIHLYHGVRAARDLYAGDALRARARVTGFNFVAVYSDEMVSTARHGLLHEAVAADFDSLSAASIYCAGPPVMVDAVKRLALQRGASAAQLHADAFYAAEPEKKGLWASVSRWRSG